MARKRSNKRFYRHLTNRWFLATLFLLVILVIASELTGATRFFSDPEPEPKTANNLSPKTNTPQQKKPASPSEESKNLPPPQSTPTSGNQKKSVTPRIDWAMQDTNGAVLVKATVPGIFEEGGQCMAVLTMGSIRVTGSVSGFGNVSETNCPQISIPRSKLKSGGTWNVQVVYSSAKSYGESAQQTVVVK